MRKVENMQQMVYLNPSTYIITLNMIKIKIPVKRPILSGWTKK